jgi:hypothetical protein
MRHPFSLAAGALSALLFAIVPAKAAQLSEAAFYKEVAGSWSGPGEIVAGKYKGTKFTCDFKGAPPSGKDGLAINGSCRVGVFAQPMTASLEKRGKGFTGRFLDGENGEGMNITGGRYSARRLVVDIKRKDLHGVMSTRLTEDDKLNITISVRVQDRLIPVIGMLLDRRGTDKTVTSAITD